MKDVSYFKEKIEAKLDCAEDFSEMALELKSSNFRASKILMELSDMEIKAAEKLENIMDELYGGVNHAEGYGMNDYNDYHHDIMQRYSAARNNVRNMKDMYSKRYSTGEHLTRYDARPRYR